MKGACLHVFLFLLPIGSLMGIAKTDFPDNKSAPSSLITFRVATPVLSDSDVVYIAGSDSNLGNWAPGSVPLERIQRNLWQISLRFSTGMRIEYKFTRGGWGKEAC